MSLIDRIKKALGIRSPSKVVLEPVKEKQEPPQAVPCGEPMERTSTPMTYKLGSLFDGSGGFPLAGSFCGIVPVWAAEVEPYPIAVTRSRFPNMLHLGDISKVNGAEIEPVDIITFGSPCQDLSVAGKRAGLKHADNGDEETTRSGLFMEAVRIIKEMREATNGVYPKFALWENVPGAFSSNKGEDFKIVCEELIKIVEPTAVMPAVPKNGWAYADSYCGDGWSLAYRVFDAQYWGVPQRRRRIHLIVDFTGQCARNVLFEREGVRGYFETGRTPWQGTAPAPQNGSGATNRQTIGLDLYNLAVSGDIAVSLTANTGTSGTHSGPTVAVPYTMKIRSGCEGGGKGALVQEDKSATLATNNDQYLFQPMSLREENWAESGVKNAIRAGESKSPHAVVSPVACYDARGNGDGETVNTLTGDHNRRTTDYSSVVVETKIYESHPQDSRIKELEGAAPTVSVKWHKGAADTPLVVESAPAYSIQGNTIDRNAQQNGSGICENVSHTINAMDRHGVAYSMKSIARNGKALTEQANPICASDYKDPDIVAYPVCENHPVAYLASGGNTVGTLMAASLSSKQCLGNQEAFSGDYHIIEETVEPAAGVDCRNATEYPELNGTLQAKANGGFSLNCNQIVRINYIVRRLTPTECARLQGFADEWGHIDQKEILTPEEYAFWLEVRNTHAAINGKAVKEYTEKQMLTWYNKLHTDSAEYKMWGNGIALPPALYCMQGISDALGIANENPKRL